MKAHPLAVVSPLARIAADVQIGPFVVIEPDVTIAEGCKFEARAVVKSGTTIGPNNHVFEGAVLGGLPQHVNVPERLGKVAIGSGNTIRENVTIHRALSEDEATIVGDDNLVMVNTHIAHDCRIGNHVILVNNVIMAGHVTIEDRAFVSGAGAIHQFCRIGSLAMVGGRSLILQDVPPYVTVDGHSSLVVGLNSIGLRRAGYNAKDLRQLKEAYRVIYRSRLTWNEILARLETEFNHGLAARFHQFLSTTTRGIIAERRLPPGATIKLHRETDRDAERQTRVG